MYNLEDFVDEDSPYNKMFGGYVKGRPGVDTPAYEISLGNSMRPITVRDLGLPNDAPSRRIAKYESIRARNRANMVVAKLHDEEVRAVYAKERLWVIEQMKKKLDGE